MKGTNILNAAPMIGRHFRRAQIFRGQHALHDEEVRRPVREGNHEAQAEDDAGPVNAHRVVFE